MKRFTMEEERGLHQLFEIGIILKALDGLLEIIGGSVLLFLSPVIMNKAILYLAQFELAEDPRDFFLNYLLRVTQNFTPHAQFYSSLFLSHGAIKLVLMVGLLRNKRWAYPATIAVFTLFVLYQLYQITFSHSVFLSIITAVDIVVVALVVHEYRHAKKEIAR